MQTIIVISAFVFKRHFTSSIDNMQVWRNQRSWKLKRVFFSIVATIALFDVIILLVNVQHMSPHWTSRPVIAQLSSELMLVERESVPQGNYTDMTKSVSFTKNHQSAVNVASFSRYSPLDHLDVDSVNTMSDLSTRATKTSHASNNELDSIGHDLVRCSLSMGVPLKTLDTKEPTLRKTAEKAHKFLNAVHLLVPLKLAENSCWYINISTFGQDKKNIRAELKKLLSSNIRVQGLTKRLFKSQQLHKIFVCLPSFFIAGFPKSATTSLDNAFRKHPQIIGPLSKEPHWWTRAQNITHDNDYAQLSLYTYLLNFKPLAEHLSTKNVGQGFITYDGSQSTLWDSNFFINHQDYCAMPAVLSRVLPNAKFIVMMRNPTSRLFSHHLWSHSSRYGNDIDKWPPHVKGNISELFHIKVTEAVDQFRECLRLSSLFECVNEHVSRRTNSGVSSLTHRIVIGLYHVHLMKWFQFYPRKQFLLLRMENLMESPAKVMSQVTQFLEVDEVSEDEAEQWFSEKANVNQAAEAKKVKMQDRTKIILEEFYSPYNKMLADLLDNDSFLWSAYTGS